MNSEGLGPYPPAPPAGLGPYPPGQQPSQQQPLMTMEERTGALDAALAANPGMSVDQAAALIGLNAPAAAPPSDDRMGRVEYALRGLQEAASQGTPGLANLAGDWVKTAPLGGLEDWAGDAIGDVGEWVGGAIGPSEETRAEMREFELTPDGQQKTFVGEAVDAVNKEVIATMAPTATGAAIGTTIAPGAGTAIGAGLGAAFSVGRQYDEARNNLYAFNKQKFIDENGREPTEKELDAMYSRDDLQRATGAAAVGLLDILPIRKYLSFLKTIPGGKEAVSKMAQRAVTKQPLIKAALEGGGIGLIYEGLQEVAEEAALVLLTEKDLMARAREKWAEGADALYKFAENELGRRFALTFVAGGALGAGMGVPTNAIEQKAKNELATQRASLVGNLADQRGASMEDISTAIKDGRANEVAEAGLALETAQRRLRKSEEAVREAEQAGMPEEAVGPMRELVSKRKQQLDDLGDEVGKRIGVANWLPKKEVDRIRDEREKAQRKEALARLDVFGERVDKDIPTETVLGVAERLERADAKVEQLTNRVDAITESDRKAKAITELENAKAERQKARIEAKVKLQGLTPIQASQQVKRDDSMSEKARRQEQQREGRERAIQRQAEIEFPETMAPEQKKLRAQEIVDEFEATGKTDKGLENKIARLRRQRRGATSEEEIDRITNEIADLEARRGLPTPAVEAARRVLQDQGEPSQAGLGEQSPEAGTAEAEGEPRVSAQEGSEAANSQEPAGEVETEVAPESASEPAGAAARARASEEISRWIEDPEILKAYPDLEEQVAGYIQDRADAVADGDVTKVEAFDMLSDFQDDYRAGEAPSAEEYFGARIAPEVARVVARASVDRERTETTSRGYDYQSKPFRDLTKALKDPKTLKAAEKAMREWTAKTGFEAAAHIGADGKVIGIGTNDDPNVVMPLVDGVGDMAVIFTHTHTADTPFSTSDLAAMMQDPQPFRAILPEGEIQATPLKALTRPEFLRLNRAVFAVMGTMIPKGSIDPFSRDRIRQEVMTQALEEAGAISYDVPFRNLTSEEREYVDTIFQALSGPIATLRGRVDGRPGIEETGSLWREPGERRAEDAAVVAGATPDPFAELDIGPDPFGELAEDAEFDAELGLDNPVYRSSQRERKANYTAERVTQLGDEVWQLIPTIKGDADIVKLYNDGRLTREGVDRGIAALLNAVGNKEMFATLDAAKAMFPGFVIKHSDTYPVKVRPGKRDSGQTKRYVEKDKKVFLKAAFDLTGLVNRTGHGEFIRSANWVKNKAGQPIKTHFHRISPELAEFVGFKGPAGAWFDPPVSDPKDTRKLLRDPVHNLFTEDALAPARRTAEYLQANHYTIDEDWLRTIEPKDLISKKALGADGHRPEHVDQWLEIHSRPKEAWTKADRTFVKDYWKIGERLRTATYKLEAINQAYDTFVERHGKDAKVGFMYQVDNRARIYADGSFHPQAGGAIKGLFVHEGMPLRNMVEVDNSASGWQVNALMARDDVGAPILNMGRGQATQPGYKKTDIYTDTIELLRQRLQEYADVDLAAVPSKKRHTAAKHKKAAQIFLDHIYPGGQSIMDKNTIKRPIIAMNYGGDEVTFRRAMVNALSDRLPYAFNEDGGSWGFISHVAMKTVEDRMPASVKLQKWAIDAVEELVKAVEKGSNPKDPPKLQFSVGLNGRVAVKKGSRFDWETRFERTNPDKSRDHLTIKARSDRDNVNAKSTGRAVWANLIQGFDAAILHRSVERYKVATNGAFVTTNHDSFTVPPEFEGQMAAAVRESMGEIMNRIDVPRRLYDEIMAQARIYGVENEINVEMFDGYGNYNFDDLQTSTPLFGEDQTREDYVPEYAELPETGPLPEDTVTQETATIPGEELQRRADEVRERAAVSAERRAEREAALEAPVEAPAPAAMLARRSRDEFGNERPSSGFDMYARVQDEIDFDNEQYIDRPDRRENLETTFAKYANSERVTGALERLRRAFFRETANYQQGLKDIESDLGMTEALVKDGMSRMVQMLTNESSRINTMLYYAPPKWNAEEQIYEADNSAKPLAEILKFDGPEDYARFGRYAYARLDRNRISRGIDPRIVDDLRNRWLDVEPGVAARYDQMLDDYAAFNTAMLREAQGSGLISQEQFDALVADGDYVPMFRVFDDVGEFGLQEFFGKKGLTHPDPGIMSLKDNPLKIGETLRDASGKVIAEGGKLGDIVENMQKNAIGLLMASQQNRAHARIYDFLTGNMAPSVETIAEKTGIVAKTLKEGEKKEARNIGERPAMMFRRNGEKVYWKATGDPRDTYSLTIALSGLKPEAIGALQSALKAFNSFRRATVTGTPTFAARAMIRDLGQAYIQSGTGPGKVVARNVDQLAQSFGEYNSETVDLMLSAGVGAWHLGGTMNARASDIRAFAGAQERSNWDRTRDAWKSWESVVGSTEIGVRKAVYDRVIAQGGSRADAAYEARNHIDYGRHGAARAIRTLNYLILFLNPRIQGLYRIGEATGPERAKRIAGLSAALVTRGMVYMGVSLALRSMIDMLPGGDDEEDGLNPWQRTYRDISPEMRALNMYIPLPFTDGRLLRILRPFELGAAFGAIPVQAAYDSLQSKSGAADLGKVLSHTFLETFSFNPLKPEIVKPLIDVFYSNKKSFGGMPIETTSMEGLPKFMRSDERTGGIATIGADLVNAAVDYDLMSPIQMQYLAQQYLGPLGMYFYDAADAALAAAGLVEDKGVLAPGIFGRVPVGGKALETVFGGFFSKNDREAATRWSRDFYDINNKIKSYNRGLTTSGASGVSEDFVRLAKNKQALQLAGLKDVFGDAAKEITDIRKQMRDVQNNDGLSRRARENALAQGNFLIAQIQRDAVSIAQDVGITGSFASGVFGTVAGGRF